MMEKNEKKEVNIITCHWPINYGAVLQAYALQTYIGKQDYDVKIIDYIPTYAKDWSLRGIIRLFLRGYDFIKGYCSFASFRKKYLKLTKKMKNNIDSDIDREDILFIAGSDQIWNPILDNGKDDNYFLSFVKKGTKVSYAASIGIKDIPEDRNDYYYERLKGFSSISVREKSAMLAFEKIKIPNVKCVVDPVFLLSKDEWKELVSNVQAKEDYILIYAFRRDSTIYNYAKRLAEKRGYKVYAITNSLIDVKNGVDRLFWNPSPETFVSLFCDAAEIVTNSFHGFSFSIIFEKPMHVFELNSAGNERLLYLAERFGLTNRLLKDDIKFLDSEIIISNNNDISESKKYLEDMLLQYANK